MTKSGFFPVYVFIILALTIALATKPSYNWDMLPYMSIIKKMDGEKPFSKIHEDVYTIAKKNIPANKYYNLVNPKFKYRKEMLENDSAFETQVPFFNIKPIYLITSYLFYKIGASLNYATVLPSLLAFVLINIVSFYWCKRFSLSFKEFIVALFLICLITIPLAARSNPDGLSCLFLLIASFFFLEFKNLFFTILFLVFSILTRPDNIIFSVLLLAIIPAGRWEKKVSFFTSAICFAILFLVYFLLVVITPNHEWSTLFYHAFINNTVSPSVKHPITIPLYLNVIQRNVLNLKGIIAFAFLLILSIQMLQFKKNQTKKDTLYKLFYIIVLIWTALKFSLFPMMSIRFISPPLLLLFFSVIKVYETRISKLANTGLNTH